MGDLLAMMTSRPLIISLAVVGALLVVLASLMKKQAEEQGLTGSALFINRLGYALTFVSIALFIVAGFLSDR